MELLQRFRQGDVRALAKVVSWVEDQRDGYQDLLGTLYPEAGRSLRLGITGPPGAGKSTLVNALTHEYLPAQRKVGIIAVDPTSPFTGGALLGDRVRMNDFPSDGSFYFRSMATRGATGGLAAATGNVAVIYDAFGFDITLIETVGVGQMELDVVDACDTVVVVVVPESGDAVQTMKAGLMEIADIFCVNKADRPGADRVVLGLEQAIDTRRRGDRQDDVVVLATEAINGKNIKSLIAAIEKHVTSVRSDGRFVNHRRSQTEKNLLALLEEHVNRQLLLRLRQVADLDQIVSDICEGRTDPFTASQQLLRHPAMKLSDL